MPCATVRDADDLPLRWTARDVWALAAWIVPLLLPVLLFVLVARDGVNVPFMDEWVWAKLIVDTNHANPVVLLWTFQQNEHRVVFPSLIAVLLSHWGGYNSLRLMLFAVALVALTQLTLLRLIARTMAADVAPYVFFGASILLFGLAQAENWLSGFQFSWFFVNYLVITMISLLTTADLDWRRVSSAAVIAFAACFSLTFGLASLPIGFLLIVARGRAALSKLAAWMAFSIAITTLYLWNLHPTVALTMHREVAPYTYLRYFLVYVGSPIYAWAGEDASASCGAALLGFFVATVVAVAFTKKQRAALPWFAIACYGIACGALTAYGRGMLGQGEALSLRYQTTASTIWIGLVGMLGSALWPFFRTRIGRASLPIAGGLLVAFALVLVPQELLGFNVMGTTYTARLAALNAVRNYRLEPPEALQITFPSGTYVFDILSRLEHDGSGSFLPKDCPRKSRPS